MCVFMHNAPAHWRASVASESSEADCYVPYYYLSAVKNCTDTLHLLIQFKLSQPSLPLPTGIPQSPNFCVNSRLLTKFEAVAEKPIVDNPCR